MLKDLKRLKEKNRDISLKIQYSKQDGYVVIGESRTKRYIIERLVHDVLNSPNSEWIMECIWGNHEKQISSIRLQLERAERKLGITFTDERLHELSYLFSMYRSAHQEKGKSYRPTRAGRRLLRRKNTNWLRR
ncbi:hypothetical protein RCO48_21350 [Peribacillus frigoritolerans]|nr:hypothetical protein [Peribacillus frigoritolerans]